MMISFCRGAGSSLRLLSHSRSMSELVHPESISAFVPTHWQVVSISKCTRMERSCFFLFGFSSEIPATIFSFLLFFIILLFLVFLVFLPFSSSSLWVCLCCRIVYLGMSTAVTGTGAATLAIHSWRHQFRLIA